MKVKYLLGGALVLGALSSFGKKKLDEIKNVVGQLKFNIKNISSFSYSSNAIKFNAILSVENPTDIDFGATLPSSISIKAFRVYNLEGVYLGVGNTNINNLAIPSRSSLDIEQIQVSLDSAKALKEVTSHLQLYFNNDFSRLYFEIDVVAFGSTLTLSTKNQ